MQGNGVEDVAKLLTDINNLPSSVDVDNLPSSVDVDNIETDNSTSEHSPGMDLSSESDNGSNKADDSSSVSDSAVGTVIKDVERTPGNLFLKIFEV